MAQINDPEVRSLIKTVFEACKCHDIPIGISTGPSPSDLDMWFEFGIDFIFMPNEFDWVRIGSQNALNLIKSYERRTDV